MRLRATLLSLALAFAGASAAKAEIRTSHFDYKDGDTILEGSISWDDARHGKLPGVLVFHQWTGPTDFELQSAKDLAKLGYVAMVADVYGKGVRPPAPKLSGAEMGKYLANRPLLRARVNAALDRLLKDPHVDATRIGAIGYCFGGAPVLELGREGAAVKALVTFHGDLSSPTPADAKNIKGAVLVLHGADDPVVGPAEVDAFKSEMKSAGADLTFVAYSGTVHSFTMPSAGNDNSKGAAYNARSAKRSWETMKDFLADTLKK